MTLAIAKPLAARQPEPRKGPETITMPVDHCAQPDNLQRPTRTRRRHHCGPNTKGGGHCTAREVTQILTRLRIALLNPPCICLASSADRARPKPRTISPASKSTAKPSASSAVCTAAASSHPLRIASRRTLSQTQASLADIASKSPAPDSLGASESGAPSPSRQDEAACALCRDSPHCEPALTQEPSALHSLVPPASPLEAPFHAGNAQCKSESSGSKPPAPHAPRSP